MELRCPKCQALVYSRKTKLCDRCGAALPPEPPLSDQQKEEKIQRQELIDRLASALDGSGAPPRRRRSGSRAAKIESALEEVACLGHFQERGVPPICPRCHENVTTCAAVYCFVCGRRIRQQRCGRCGTNESSWGLLEASRVDGPISYCPSCGVRIHSPLTRWRPEAE